MIEIIQDVPDDILAVAVRGKITKKDYAQTLIPAMERRINEYGKIKLLFSVGALEKIDLGAMWEDAKFGLTHWSDFSHIALVTDVDWVESATTFFTPFFPGEVKIFDKSAFDEAQEWLVTRKRESNT